MKKSKQTETLGESDVDTEEVHTEEEGHSGRGCCSGKTNALFTLFAGVLQSLGEVVLGLFCPCLPQGVTLATTLLIFDMIVYIKEYNKNNEN